MANDAEAFDLELEKPLVARRRAVWRTGTAEAELKDKGEPHAALAFSGGGIRSAIVSLGLAQALAEYGLFRKIDYLSTVSGGGYTGTFLGSLFLPRKPDLSVPDPAFGNDTGATDSSRMAAALAAARRAEELLRADPQVHEAEIDDGAGGKARIVHPLRWLRENGRYLTPGGPGDAMYMAAYYVRALLGVLYVTVMALMFVALGVYLLRLGASALAAGTLWPLVSPYDWAARVEAGSAAWVSVLWWLPLGAALITVGPLIAAYWTVYRQESRSGRSLEEWSIEAGPYLLAILSAIAWLAVRLAMPGNALHWVPAYGMWLGLSAVLIRNVLVGMALSSTRAEQIGWAQRVARAARAVAAYAWTTESGEVARARQKLTRWLSAALYLTFGLLALALIDLLGQALYVVWRRHDMATAGASGASMVALALLLWKAAGWLASKNVKGWAEKLMRYRKPIAMLLAAAAVLALATLAFALIQAIVWSAGVPLEVDGRFTASVSHHALLGGAAAAIAVLFALVWLTVGFLNNSTLYRFYAARLTRAFLGAANFQRLKEMAQALHDGDEAAAARLFVSQSHLGDDVGLRAYLGRVSGAPLHLINATLNESVSRSSNLQREDRKGMSLSVGPAGIAVQGGFWRWRLNGAVNPLGLSGSDVGSFIVKPGQPDQPSTPATSLAQCERLSVGQWAAISGAAVSTGLGAMSSAGFSMLIWLVNARLGYWWKPAPVMVPEQRAWAMRLLRSYGLAWQEFSGGFLGRRDAYWNLSDGGHFENSGVYELIRRRVPFIVAADNAADAGYEFGDMQNLVRRARLDFGAEIRFLSTHEIDDMIALWPPEQLGVRELLGTMADFANGRASGTRCALLAHVFYPLTPGQEADAPHQRSLLLVIKPALTCFLPVDVQLYGRDNPDFPQQSTGDQFFDEAQWESYRKLGYEFGLKLFAAWDLFAEDGEYLSWRTDRAKVQAAKVQVAKAQR